MIFRRDFEYFFKIIMYIRTQFASPTDQTIGTCAGWYIRGLQFPLAFMIYDVIPIPDCPAARELRKQPTVFRW